MDYYTRIVAVVFFFVQGCTFDLQRGHLDWNNYTWVHIRAKDLVYHSRRESVIETTTLNFKLRVRYSSKGEVLNKYEYEKMPGQFFIDSYILVDKERLLLQR